MKNIILLVIILPFLTSCNDNIQENDRLNSPEALTQTEYDMAKSYLDVNTIPQLPVEAWFLAAREFEHNNKDITDSAPEREGFEPSVPYWIELIGYY